ncbi:MAG: protein phosphatase 2C domain-containing protein [Bacteroidaceae bacterium]|nr:protein phosphatase 2C domain-containing protein [Bacteroidaceae bacterium]
MKYKLKVYSIWEFGQRKDAEGNPHQEDSLYPAFGKETEADRTFILCDGMGGHDAGEVASATVCEVMSETIRNNGHDAEGVFTDDDLKAAIAAAFDALDQKDSGAEKKMGTTMTFLKLHNEGATIAHIGDSRVYHIRPGRTGEDTQILHETEDHSLVNDLIKIGELTREEARFSKQKNVITRAMQPHQERRPKADISHVKDIRPGDYFYMCSDGMLEQPDMEDGTVLKRIFSALVESDERRVEILRGATDENRDNHTAFIIRVEEVTDPIVAVGASPVSTKHMAVVEDDDEYAEADETDREERPVVRKGGNWLDLLGNIIHSPLFPKVVAGTAIVVLGLWGISFVKSCSAEPEKENVEIPPQHQGRKPAKPATPVKPSKQVQQPAQTPEKQPAKPVRQEQQPAQTPNQISSLIQGGQLPKPPADEAATVAQPQSDEQKPEAIGGFHIPTALDGDSQEEIPSSDQQVIRDRVNK